MNVGDTGHWGNNIHAGAKGKVPRARRVIAGGTVQRAQGKLSHTKRWSTARAPTVQNCADGIVLCLEAVVKGVICKGAKGKASVTVAVFCCCYMGQG